MAKRQRLHRLTDVIELFHATYAATGTSGQRATTRFQPHKSTAGKINLHFKSVTGRHNVHAIDFTRAVNDPFRQRNPIAKCVRSFGEAIITTCEMPLYTSATGTSSATSSSWEDCKSSRFQRVNWREVVKSVTFRTSSDSILFTFF